MATSNVISFSSTGFDYGVALLLLRESKRLTRSTWASGEYLTIKSAVTNTTITDAVVAGELGVATGTSVNFSAFIYKATSSTTFTPYVPSQEDLLATDWVTL